MEIIKELTVVPQNGNRTRGSAVVGGSLSGDRLQSEKSEVGREKAQHAVHRDARRRWQPSSSLAEPARSEVKVIPW